mmetsp:Transcript_19423/g.48640  ORF Transcript_19423/g.48640 Transcript_19423/m.48640 type:complete len:619 (+) Transcript_19423:3308-5164(+)
MVFQEGGFVITIASGSAPAWSWRFSAASSAEVLSVLVLLESNCLGSPFLFSVLVLRKLPGFFRNGYHGSRASFFFFLELALLSFRDSPVVCLVRGPLFFCEPVQLQGIHRPTPVLSFTVSGILGRRTPRESVEHRAELLGSQTPLLLGSRDLPLLFAGSLCSLPKLLFAGPQHRSSFGIRFEAYSLPHRVLLPFEQPEPLPEQLPRRLGNGKILPNKPPPPQAPRHRDVLVPEFLAEGLRPPFLAAWVEYVIGKHELVLALDRAPPIRLPLLLPERQIRVPRHRHPLVPVKHRQLRERHVAHVLRRVHEGHVFSQLQIPRDKVSLHVPHILPPWEVVQFCARRVSCPAVFEHEVAVLPVVQGRAPVWTLFFVDAPHVDQAPVPVLELVFELSVRGGEVVGRRLHREVVLVRARAVDHDHAPHGLDGRGVRTLVLQREADRVEVVRHEAARNVHPQRVEARPHPPVPLEGARRGYFSVVGLGVTLRVRKLHRPHAERLAPVRSVEANVACRHPALVGLVLAHGGVASRRHALRPDRARHVPRERTHLQVLDRRPRAARSVVVAPHVPPGAVVVSHDEVHLGDTAVEAEVVAPRVADLQGSLQGAEKVGLKSDNAAAEVL